MKFNAIMKNIYINFKLIVFFCCGFSLSYAQSEKKEISGILLEQKTNEPIPYASIVLIENNTKSAIGTTSESNGAFKISTSYKEFYIEISSIGYKTKTISNFEKNSNLLQLGNIQLETANENLEEVVVRGDISKTEFKLDKRVFHVGKDISSSGASALDALNNVPSVNVSVEGDISLRGNANVQILINGKPSVLTDESSNALGTITADMIESIEVITNPSAKYEASGTGGILNIILSKDEKKGINGSLSVNTGIPNNHSIGLSLNKRTDNFNLFTQLGAGYRSLPQENKTSNKDLITGELVESTGTSHRNETFVNVTLGTDYYFNKYNMITLSGNYAYEIETQPSSTVFSSYDSSDLLISQWKREETTDATNPKFQYELNYNKEFQNNEDHTLQFSALGRYFGKDLHSEFINIPISGDTNENRQQIDTDYKMADYTFKLDYTNPFTEKHNLETGIQYVINDVGNDYEVREYINGEYVINENLTNDFNYNQKVLGAYASGSYELEKWGFKAGLRLEQTDLTTLLTNTNETNKQNYTNLFPSLHSSYKLTKQTSFQIGYSKRIFRPRLRDLNPFVNIRNTYSVYIGSPDLQPEFSDSYELTSIYKIGKATLNSSLYHRFTTDQVERVTYFENNVTVTTPQNIGTKSTIGFETNGKYNANKWLSFNGDFNFNYFDRKGTFENQNFDFVGRQWSGRLGTKIGLPYDIDIEFTGHYRSSYETVQGMNSGYAFMDAGLRKKVFKGKAIVNIGVRDAFSSRIYERFVNQPTFETYNFRQRGRFVTFGISYGFGKGEAMTYSGGRRR